MMHWYAVPLMRNGEHFHRKVWTLFGLPIWFWDDHRRPTSTR